MNKILTILTLVFNLNVSANTGVPRIMINPLDHSGKIFNILFTLDGQKIISVSEDKSIRVWDANTSEMLQQFEYQVGDGPEGMFYASVISPDGKLLAVGGYPVSKEKKNYIIIIDIEKGEQASISIGHDNVINTLDFDATGKYLASGSDDGTIKLWKVSPDPKWRAATTINMNTRVASISFNKKNNNMAVSIEDKYVYLFDLNDLSKGIKNFTPSQLKKHTAPVKNVKFSPDGKYLASSNYGNEVVLWRQDGSYEIFFDDLKNPVNAITFSYDSRVMVMIDDVDGFGRSYSIPSDTKFTDYYAHGNTVFTADFSPSSQEGNYIVASAGGNNNEIYIWNPINGKHKKESKEREVQSGI